MRYLSAFVLTTSVLCATALVVPARLTNPPSKSTNWSGWRGPEGNGLSPETNLPTEWSSDKNIKWKTAIEGSGSSSPIVWGDRIFVTTDVEGDVVPGAQAVKHFIEGKEFKHPDAVSAERNHHMKVLCLNRTTGKALWDATAYEGPAYDDHHRKGSCASPTPATDGSHVYAWFGTEGLYCYDFSGKLAWKSTPGKMPKLGMGPGTSPVLYENLVILQYDEEFGEHSFIVALDKKTGKEVWKTPRKVQASWATPLIVRTPRTELITSGNELIISYDPATGKELWSTKGLENNAIPTPVAGRGMVFVSTGYPAKRTMAIKLGGSGSVAWQYDKGTAYVPSTIFYGDYLYLVSDRGILTCVEPETGKVVYEGGRVPVPATFTASPVAYDGKILLTSEDGDTFVIKAGPKHEVLATNSVGEPVYASLAVSDGMIFIRGEKNLYCIGNGRTRGE